MKHSLIGLAAGAALLIGCGIASAQDNTKIMDGNNPAPNPAPMAPAAHGSTAPSKIMDGNNPAPNPAPSASAAPKAKHASHKKHSHAS